MSAVTVKVDPDGRLLMPAAIREEIGAFPGAYLQLTVVGQRIELTSVEPPRHKHVEPAVRLVQKGRLKVAVATGDLPPVTEEDVLSIRRSIQSERPGSRT